MPAKKNRAELRKALPKLKLSRAHSFVAPEGVIQQQRIDHAVAHTARILQVLEKTTLTPASRANLEAALEDYKDLIHQAGGSSVLAESHDVLKVPGMTPADLSHDQLQAAVAHLEG